MQFMPSTTAGTPVTRTARTSTAALSEGNPPWQQPWSAAAIRP